MRNLLLASILLVGACAAAGPMAQHATTNATGAVAAADAATPGTPGAASQPDEKLVVTGYLSLSVDDGPKAMATIHSQVETAGGRVVHEEESGQDYGWTGHLTVRLPPGQVTAFVDGLAKTGSITSRRIEASDVSREYFDQELALKNDQVTLDRLQALLGNTGLTTADVLEIEREMTRVRGEIETIEGEHRFLDDRIAYATFDLDLVGSGSVVLSPKARVHPGVRASMLYLIDAATGTDKLRLGAGGTLWFRRSYALELEVFPDTGDGTGRAVLATAGGATYSDYFGAGRRRWLEPYLGGRMGYAYLDGTSRFVVSGELGLELYKGPHVIVDVAARMHAFIGKHGVEPAAQASTELVIPF
jgi:hypothetical protein